MLETLGFIVLFWFIGGVFAFMIGIVLWDCTHAYYDYLAPFENFAGWQKSKARREAIPQSNFNRYRDACIDEKKWAKSAIESILWLVGIALWPITIPLLLLFCLVYFPYRFIRFLMKFPSLIKSAKGF